MRGRRVSRARARYRTAALEPADERARHGAEVLFAEQPRERRQADRGPFEAIGDDVEARSDQVAIGHGQAHACSGAAGAGEQRSGRAVAAVRCRHPTAGDPGRGGGVASPRAPAEHEPFERAADRGAVPAEHAREQRPGDAVPDEPGDRPAGCAAAHEPERARGSRERLGRRQARAHAGRAEGARHGADDAERDDHRQGRLRRRHQQSATPRRFRPARPTQLLPRRRRPSASRRGSPRVAGGAGRAR